MIIMQFMHIWHALTNVPVGECNIESFSEAQYNLKYHKIMYSLAEIISIV